MRSWANPEKPLKLMFKSAPGAIAAVNEHVRIDMVNAETQKLYGYTGEALVGQFVEIPVPERFRATHAADREQYSSCPHQGRMEDGDISGVKVTKTPDLLRLAPGGEMSQTVANGWDMSFRGLHARYSIKVLVLIDGRTVYAPSFSGLLWEHRDISHGDVDRSKASGAQSGARTP
jgi:PAS domain-containing protein